MTKKEKELIKECLEDRIRGLRLDQVDLRANGFEGFEELGKRIDELERTFEKVEGL